MNGRINKRCILDTNAIVSILRGNQPLIDYLENAEWVGVSILSIIEFLSFPGISETDTRLLREFTKRIFIIELRIEDEVLLSNIIKIRKSKKLKLPDAIIVATALSNDCVLVTADKELKNLDVIETLCFDD